MVHADPHAGPGFLGRPVCVLLTQQEIEDEVQAAAESSEGMPGPDATIAVKTPAALRSGADRLHDQCLQLRSEKRFQQNQMGLVSLGEAGKRPPPAAAASAEAEAGSSARPEPTLAADGSRAAAADGSRAAAAAGSSAQAEGLPAAGPGPTLQRHPPQLPPCGVRAHTGISAVLGAWPSCAQRRQLQGSSREEAQLRQATAASLQQYGPAQIDLTGGEPDMLSPASALPEEAESQRPDTGTCGICLSPLGDILQVGPKLPFGVALSDTAGSQQLLLQHCPGQYSRLHVGHCKPGERLLLSNPPTEGGVPGLQMFACGHFFCDSCVTTLMQGGGPLFCPTCRRKITKSSIKRVANGQSMCLDEPEYVRVSLAFCQ